MGLRQAFVPAFIAEDFGGRHSHLFFMAIVRYFQVPLDVQMASWFDNKRSGWHLRLRHPSWPNNGVDQPEEQWDYGLEHAHLMELGCRVPLSSLACEHGRGCRPERA